MVAEPVFQHCNTGFIRLRFALPRGKTEIEKISPTPSEKTCNDT